MTAYRTARDGSIRRAVQKVRGKAAVKAAKRRRRAVLAQIAAVEARIKEEQR